MFSVISLKGFKTIMSCSVVLCNCLRKLSDMGTVLLFVSTTNFHNPYKNMYNMFSSSTCTFCIIELYLCTVNCSFGIQGKVSRIIAMVESFLNHSRTASALLFLYLGSHLSFFFQVLCSIFKVEISVFVLGLP